jgi:hypothetical protein
VGTRWTNERKASKHNIGLADAKRAILIHLAQGGAYTALDICNALFYRTGSGYIWEALLKMERESLVCRASDYEDPRTYHQWKITGCGYLAAPRRP